MTLIIGSGRAATHFVHYLHLLKAPAMPPCVQWNRKQHSYKDLQDKISQATLIWVLISDKSLETFISRELTHFHGPIIHSSGALEIEGATSLHPLMTFGPELQDLDFYRSIPFVTSPGQTLQKFFPMMENPSYSIEPSQKPLYHALCVASGNFTTLLWQEAIKGFTQLGLPPQIAAPYFEAILNGVLNHPNQALTGPLARKDSVTVEKNISSLQGQPLQDIYKSFVRNYFPEHNQ